MPGQQVTDVTHDPKWIAANYLNSHDPKQRAYGQALLENLYHERQFGEQAAGRMASIGAENRRADIAVRESRERTRQAHLDREARAQETAAYRKDVLDARSAAQKSEDQARLMAMLPEIQQTYGKQGAAITKAIMDRFLASQGVNANVAAPQTEADKAIQREGELKGKTPVQPAGQAAPATPAPAAAGQPQQGGAPMFAPANLTEGEPPRRQIGYHWFAGTGGVSGGNNASMIKYYDDGSSEVVPASSIPGMEPPGLPPVRYNVEGGRINPQFAAEMGIPPGYDFNFNTGRIVPQSYEGTINGQPSSQAVAQAALRTGKNPVYSPAAMSRLDAAKQQAADAAPYAGKPTVEVNPQGFVKTGAEGGPVPAPPGAGEPVNPITMAPAALARPQTQEQPQPQVPGQPPPATTQPSTGGTENAYNVLKTNPLDVLKNVGQGLVPGLFGYPTGTVGAERVKPPPPPPPIVEDEEKKKKQQQGG